MLSVIKTGRLESERLATLWLNGSIFCDAAMILIISLRQKEAKSLMFQFFFYCLNINNPSPQYPQLDLSPFFQPDF